MQKLSAILALSLFVAGVGCHLRNSGAQLSESQRETIVNLRNVLRDYRHVLLVCIYEDHWQDRGPHEHSLHHFKATVVRVYKGDWRISESVAFAHGVDSSADNRVNSEVGTLMFLYTNEHTNREVGVAAGEFYRYDSERARAMESLFPSSVASE